MRILVNEYCGHAFQIELSRELAKRGHEVLHLYFADNHSTPKGNLTAQSSNFRLEGVHIAMPFRKHSLLTRRKADRAYGKAVAERLAAFRPEIVLSANMPLDGQKILQRAAHQHHAAFYYWLQDVYSSAVRFVFRRKLPLLATLASSWYERLEKNLLRNSRGILCIAPGFAGVVRQWGVPNERIHVLENWAPLDEIVPTPRNNLWAKEQNLPARFRFLYSGTLGMKHRPELLLDLAKRFQERGDGQLLVIAGGAGADWLREHAQGISHDALRLLPFQPYERVTEVMGSADVLIALLDAEAGAFAVPSKVLSYLCAQRPLLLAAPSENHSVTVVRQARAGLAVEPEREAFLQAAESLLQNESLRLSCAVSARSWAEEHFNIATIADRFLDALRVAPQPISVPEEFELATL